MNNQEKWELNEELNLIKLKGDVSLLLNDQKSAFELFKIAI